MSRFWRDDYPYRFGPPQEERPTLREQMRELMEVRRELDQDMADRELLLQAKMAKEKPKEEKKKEGTPPILWYILLGLTAPFIGLVMSAFYIKLYLIVGEMVKGIK